jgi:glycosyltransferase involved in cell wall biosynthesis
VNICLVSQNYPPETARGGIGTQTWNKARALAGLGHSVHVLSAAAGPGPDLRAKIDGGVTTHRMRRPGEEPGMEFTIYYPQTYWLGYTWSVLRHLHRLMRTTSFDVIDFAEYGAEGFAYQVDRNPGSWIPVVVQLHGPLAMLARHVGWPETESDFYRVGTFMEEVSIRLADGVMACSGAIADFTSGFYKIPRETIHVVHCGVDTDVFNPGDKRGGRPTVLFVGNIALSKGVKTALEAVLRIRFKYPDIRLQIAGSGDDRLMMELRSQVDAAGARHNVEFCGFVGHERLPEYYRGADVFCSPAQYEGGTANVYIEAMACGCPVVASTGGGASEAVADRETGFLVPPNNVGAVADALDRILSDGALRKRMGEACRERAEDCFAMDKYIGRVLTVYQQAIDHSRGKLARVRAETK